MASEQVRPIRAWAEYENWSVFARLTDGSWDFVVTPTGADGEAAAGTTMSFETAIRGRYIEAPLRSLRVLFSTGHEVLLEQSPCGVEHEDWEWLATLMQGGAFRAERISMPNSTSDADAVQRAIDAAVQWIGEQGQ